MTTEYEIKLIKLITGEQLITTLNKETSVIDGGLVVLYPVVLDVEFYYDKDGRYYETHLMKPWMPLSDDVSYGISNGRILVICDASEETKSKYSSFLKGHYKTKSSLNPADTHDHLLSNTIH